MDSEGNLRVIAPEGAPDELIALADDMDAKLKFVQEKLQAAGESLQIDITNAPRKHVKNLIRVCKERGFKATEDLSVNEKGKKFLRLRKK